MAEEFPWTDVLPARDRRQFVAEFARAVHVSAELGEWTHLAIVLQQWKATAQVHADPRLRKQLTGDLDGDLGPIPVPAAV